MGLCQNLRNLQWYEEEDSDSFFPRAYMISEPEERDAFIGACACAVGSGSRRREGPETVLGGSHVEMGQGACKLRPGTAQGRARDREGRVRVERDCARLEQGTDQNQVV